MSNFHPVQIKTLVPCWGGILAGVLALMPVASAPGMVVSFDDLNSGVNLTGSSYSGLIWEQGSPGLGALPGVWYTDAPPLAYPSSMPRLVINAQGSTLMGIAFPSLVDMQGAFFAVQGNGKERWATAVRAHGFQAGLELDVTPWLSSLTTTPKWIDMTSLPLVDRIVIESAPGMENAGYYGLDDLTFTYIPEPASLSLLALGALVLCRNRR